MSVDLEDAKSALEFVKGGASAFEATVNAYKSLKSLFSSSETPPITKVTNALEELNSQILLSEEENITLRKAIIALERRILDLENREDKFAGYELWETSLRNIVYRSASEVTPVHYLCPSCKDEGVKTILQGDQYDKECRAKPGHGIFLFETHPDSALTGATW